MIVPAAIAAALAFWTPFHGGTPIPCTANDVHVYDKAPVDVVLDPTALGFAYTRDEDGNPLPPHCDVYISRHVADDYSPAEQCEVAAHEWGHAWFLLNHSDDPRNIMFARGLINPAACMAIQPAAVAVTTTSVSMKVTVKRTHPPARKKTPHAHHRKQRRHVA